MQLLSYEFGDIKKYILYSNINNLTKLLYVYKIYCHNKYTTLEKYDGTKLLNLMRINTTIPFDKKYPLDSIDKFYKILMLENN